MPLVHHMLLLFSKTDTPHGAFPKTKTQAPAGFLLPRPISDYYDTPKLLSLFSSSLRRIFWSTFGWESTGFSVKQLKINKSCSPSLQPSQPGNHVPGTAILGSLSLQQHLASAVKPSAAIPISTFTTKEQHLVVSIPFNNKTV